MPEEKPKKPRWKRWYWRLFGIALVLLALISGLVVHVTAQRAALRRRIQAELDAIRAAGYPVTPEELNAWYEEPPPGQNAADIYIKAASQLDRLDNAELDRLPVVGKGSLKRSEPMSDDIKKLVEKSLTKNAAALELFHKAATMRSCRYPVDFTQIWDSEAFFEQMGPLRDVRAGVPWLRLEAILHAENGEPGPAAKSVESSVALARSLAKYPSIVAHLVRIQCEHSALHTLERVLTRAALPEEQLIHLSGILEQPDRDKDLVSALAGERCLGLSAFTEVLESPRGAIATGLGAGGGIKGRIHDFLGLIEHDNLFFLDVTSRSVEIAKRPFPGRVADAWALSEEIVARLDEQIMPPGEVRLVSKVMLVGLGCLFVEDAKGIARLGAARTALAVERFRLKRGKLPEKLTELVPGFISAVPADPFDGKPLRYEKLEKGYVVYSVGEDAKYDGGSEAPDLRDITFTVER